MILRLVACSTVTRLDPAWPLSGPRVTGVARLHRVVFKKIRNILYLKCLNSDYILKHLHQIAPYEIYSNILIYFKLLYYFVYWPQKLLKIINIHTYVHILPITMKNYQKQTTKAANQESRFIILALSLLGILRFNPSV